MGYLPLAVFTAIHLGCPQAVGARRTFDASRGVLEAGGSGHVTDHVVRLELERYDVQSEKLFPRAVKSSATSSCLWALRHAANAAGLEGLTPHELRHTAASLAVSAGANVKAVQRMLGHASAAMTLDVYSGLFDDDLDGVAERLDAGARVYSMCTDAPVVPLAAESAGR